MATRQITRAEYTERLKFEHELISRRIGWLLTSQGLLFAAYGVTLGKTDSAVEQFRGIMPWLGILLATAVLCGVLASARAKYQTWQDFKSTGGNGSEPFWVNTTATYLGLVPDFALPVIFIGAWLVLLC